MASDPSARILKHQADVKILSSHQPNFLCRLKTLAKIASSDIWLVLDDVQFAHREWQNRTVISPYRKIDEQRYLTLPVRRPRGRASLVHEVVCVSPVESLHKIALTVRHAYSRAPHGKDAYQAIEPLLEEQTDNLSRLATTSMITAFNLIDRKPPSVLHSSQLTLSQQRVGRLIDATIATGARYYLSGEGARAYLTEDTWPTQISRILWQLPIDSQNNWMKLATCWNHSYIEALARFGREEVAKFLNEYSLALRTPAQ